MNGLISVIPDAPATQKERVGWILDALATGGTPPLRCSGCDSTPGGRCPSCAWALDAADGASDAAAKAQAAPTGVAALAVLMDFVAGLAGAEVAR